MLQENPTHLPPHHNTHPLYLPHLKTSSILLLLPSKSRLEFLPRLPHSPSITLCLEIHLPIDARFLPPIIPLARTFLITENQRVDFSIAFSMMYFYAIVGTQIPRILKGVFAIARLLFLFIVFRWAELRGKACSSESFDIKSPVEGGTVVFVRCQI